MAKLSNEEIQAILEAYEECGTYSGAAKKTHRSAATVKRYVEEAKKFALPTNAKLFSSTICPMEELVLPKDWSEWTTLTEAEIEDVREIQEELK